MFVAMGLSAVFPALHGIELHGIEDMQRKMGLSWVVLQGILYVLGAVIYAVSIITFLQSLVYVGAYD
jgi:adiponectin receptor